MNDQEKPTDSMAEASREEILAAQFANLVLQDVNMALLCLGKVPHPESGEHMKDLEAARHFIDQLEMLEVKTKGNLDAHEASLLKKSLTTLRMAFVEAAAEPSPQPAPKPETGPAPAAGAPQAAPKAQEQPPAGQPLETGSEADPRKKFVKKY